MSMKNVKKSKVINKIESSNRFNGTSEPQENSISSKLGNQFKFFFHIFRGILQSTCFSNIILDYGSQSQLIIRRLQIPHCQSEPDPNSNNLTKQLQQSQQEILLDLGQSQVPSSLGFVMPVQQNIQKREKSPIQDQLLDANLIQSQNEDHQQHQIKKEKTNIQSLKSLSALVKEFVGEHKETTYKQMAEVLIKQLSPDFQDNKNLKRRVYDCINVMVALGVLQKNKKIITKGQMFQSNLLNINSKYEKYGREAIERLKLQKQEKQKVVNVKKKIFTKWTQKVRGLEALVNQNRVSLQSESFIQSTSNAKLFHFPLIMFYQKSDKRVTVDCNESRNELMIQSKEQIKLFGDFDLVLQVKRVVQTIEAIPKQKNNEQVM